MSVVSTDLHGPEGIDPTKVDPESLLKKASEPPPAWLEFLRPWLYPSSFLSVTISCGLGIYSTWADTARVSFIITNYVMFLVIFCFLRWAQEISSLKDTTEEEEDMKVVFRSLSVAASGWFSMQIASMVPWELAAVIWTLWLPIVLAEAYVNHKYSNVPPVENTPTSRESLYYLSIFFMIFVVDTVLMTLERAYNFYVYLTSKDLDDAGSSRRIQIRLCVPQASHQQRSTSGAAARRREDDQNIGGGESTHEKVM